MKKKEPLLLKSKVNITHSDISEELSSEYESSADAEDDYDDESNDNTKSDSLSDREYSDDSGDEGLGALEEVKQNKTFTARVSYNDVQGTDGRVRSIPSLELIPSKWRLDTDVEVKNQGDHVTAYVLLLNSLSYCEGENIKTLPDLICKTFCLALPDYKKSFVEQKEAVENEIKKSRDMRKSVTKSLRELKKYTEDDLVNIKESLKTAEIKAVASYIETMADEFIKTVNKMKGESFPPSRKDDVLDFVSARMQSLVDKEEILNGYDELKGIIKRQIEEYLEDKNKKNTKKKNKLITSINDLPNIYDLIDKNTDEVTTPMQFLQPQLKDNELKEFLETIKKSTQEAIIKKMKSLVDNEDALKGYNNLKNIIKSEIEKYLQKKQKNILITNDDLSEISKLIHDNFWKTLPKDPDSKEAIFPKKFPQVLLSKKKLFTQDKIKEFLNEKRNSLEIVDKINSLIDNEKTLNGYDGLKKIIKDAIQENSKDTALFTEIQISNTYKSVGKKVCEDKIYGPDNLVEYYLNKDKVIEFLKNITPLMKYHEGSAIKQISELSNSLKKNEENNRDDLSKIGKYCAQLFDYPKVNKPDQDDVNVLYEAIPRHMIIIFAAFSNLRNLQANEKEIIYNSFLDQILKLQLWEGHPIVNEKGEDAILDRNILKKMVKQYSNIDSSFNFSMKLSSEYPKKKKQVDTTKPRKLGHAERVESSRKKKVTREKQI